MMKKKNLLGDILIYLFLITLSIFMIYPLLWLLGSAFKDNNEIITSISIFPRHLNFDSFIQGWKGNGKVTYSNYFVNTFAMVLPTVLFTVISSLLVAYGFARFRFPLKKLLFALVISTLLLPQEILLVPRYLLFNRLGWLDSYKPFIIPAMFATYPFFVYMMIQFIRESPWNWINPH